MNSLTNRYKATIYWRQVKHKLPSPASTPSISDASSIWTKLDQRNNLFGSNFILALIITIVILIVQLFIAHHYLGSHERRHALVSNRNLGEESFLLNKPTWFCHSYLHLNIISELAAKHQVELVIVDEDLLNSLADGETSPNLVGAKSNQIEFTQQFSGKIRQEASHKSIIHLAVINETSGGQPNLIALYDDLKNYYHMLKYDDTSETMAPEVYRRHANLLDDVQIDALRDSGGGQQHKTSEMMRQQLVGQNTYEISKIYTEFMAHLFILNTSSSAFSSRPSKLCDNPETTASDRRPFVVIHLFVLYNYEYRPQEEWIQSSLALNEIERHRLLAYGVHSVDFGVPLSHSFIHTKRDTSSLIDAHGLVGYKLKPEKHMAHLRVFEPPNARSLTYANNTYLHCKRSSFNISGLIDSNRKINEHLRSLDASKLPRSGKQHAWLSEQISIAIKFMNVFSRTYGGFSFWVTGSSLLSYHKFCQLTAGSEENAQGNDEYGYPLSYDHYDYSSARLRNRPSKDEEISLDLEIGLFSSEIDPSMLNDLSKAKMIGVTMISNWRKTNSRVSFHVKDCPNILFNLHFYELRRDFYWYFYVTNDSMLYKHNFRHKKSVPNMSNNSSRNSGFALSNAGYHVFTTSNLDLCWTRIDNIHPFRVPCEVHDHLRRIYVI